MARKVNQQEGRPIEDLDEDDLQKALDKVVAHAEEGSDLSRKEALLQKALESDLSDEENNELLALMGGSGATESEPLAKSATSGLEADDRLQKSVEVSPFLHGIVDGLEKGLTVIADEVEKSRNQQGEFNVVLAKAIKQVGMLCKSLDDRLGNIEEQPAGPPRAMQRRPQGQPINKSMAGQDPTEDRLSKGEALEIMEAMNIAALRKGDKDASDQITKSIAKFESTNHMSKAMVQKVMGFRAQLRQQRSNGAAA